MVDVIVLTLQKILFEGRAKSVILPGERGVFEVMPFHKPLLTRLITGSVLIDGRRYTIRRGIAKVAFEKVTIVVEDGT